MKKLAIVLAVASALCTGLSFAHSGGTDKYGCHTDHKTGAYHCH